MKPNVIIALLVGAAVGFFAGKMVGGTSGNSPSIAVAPSPTPGAPAAPGAAETLKVPLDNAPVSGKAEALVTIVEFSDYQCPFCSKANATVKQLQQDYGDKVRVAMKQNPLSFHPFARPAALAALAAGEQGKYWEMHHKLFENATALDDASLEKYAGEVGLNVGKWKEDLKQQKFADTISADQALAGKLGATGTPAFFINGIKITGAQPIGNFKQVIDAELKKAQDLVKTGVAADQVYAKIMAGAKERPTPQAAAPAPSAPAAPPPPSVRKINVPEDAPAKGPKYAKVTIVEWSDFQCPFCSRVGPTMKQIEDTYGKDVKVVFRHQPLPFHDKAKLAAEASMAAHEQGKFWQMHDKLFANQQALDRASIEKYGQEIGLDMGKFKAALDTGKFTRSGSRKTRLQAWQVGANGTPTFFINGREFVGAQPFEAFKPVIEAELKRPMTCWPRA